MQVQHKSVLVASDHNYTKYVLILHYNYCMQFIRKLG